MKASIIIPCYNEEKDIKRNVIEKVLPFLKSSNIDYELILVNDGSKDNTEKEINSIEGVVPVSYTPNRGKGGAVAEGIRRASGDYVLFMDADLSTDLKDIITVNNLIDKYDMVIGSRHDKDSKLPQKQPLIRQFIGWCCRLLVNMKFHFHLKDTQCGFKAIKSDWAKFMVERQIVNDFAFDVEYLYIAKLNGLSIKSIGVTWKDDRGSTVRVGSSSKKFLKDMSKIKKNKKNYIKN